MTVDRRAEAAMGLEEILEVQGYAIVPLLMQPMPKSEYSNGGWEATELPLKDRYEHAYLGMLEPPLRDPFNPQHESRFGRFLIFNPAVMRVTVATPLNGVNIDDFADELRNKGMAILDTSKSEGRVVGISRKIVAPVTASIY